jgi:hypothetical protein
LKAAKDEDEEEEQPPADEEDEEDANNLEMSPKTLDKRVKDLIESITYQAFNFTRRGTFE